MDFLSSGNILLVGDGDFSFSVALSKYPQFQAEKVTSSNLETPASISVHAQAAENMANLMDMGVSVFLEVDARDLHSHDVISKKKYDKIIFNFPLADRHNIKKNRALLADFFVSCSHILKINGQVMVTLCKGQGGTPADQPVRSWHDSWQIVAMATNAGFLLQSVTPFDASCFPEYHSVGFRFQDKSFDTSGSLTHIFYMAELIKETDLGVRGTVSYNDQIYSCSRYVCDKMKRDLLLESSSPVAILKSHLVSALTSSLKCHRQIPSPPVLLPGFKSYVHSMTENQMESCVCDENSDIIDFAEVKSEKERKNRETFDKLQKTSFTHGKDSSNGMASDDSASKYHLFLPANDEDVYILIRTLNDSQNQFVHLEKSYDDETHNFQGSSEACFVDDSKDEISSHLQNEDFATPSSVTDHSSLVFHLRVSLLENLPKLWEEVISPELQLSSMKDSEVVASQACSSHVNVMNLSSKDRNQESSIQCLDCAENQACDSQHFQHVGNCIFGFMDSSFCLITAGQSLMPGSIQHDFLPVKQELMIVHQMNRTVNFEMEPTTSTNLLSTSCMDKGISKSLNEVSHQVLTSLQNSQCFSQGFSFSLKPNVLRSISLQGFDHSVTAKEIFLVSQNHDYDTVDRAKVYQNLPIGHILYAQKGETLLHITLLSLTDLACQLWSIHDKRLLWCTEERFLSQFHSFCPAQKLKPLCLYPMKFVHDVSFWENTNSHAEFNVENMYNIIRNIAGDIVVHVSLVDTYVCGITKCRSRCYRLYFESHYQALPYLTSWRLQSEIRMEMARTLGITLR